MPTPPHTSPLPLIPHCSLAFVFGAELGVWYVLCAPRGAGPAAHTRRLGCSRSRRSFHSRKCSCLMASEGRIHLFQSSWGEALLDMIRVVSLLIAGENPGAPSSQAFAESSDSCLPKEKKAPFFFSLSLK